MSRETDFERLVDLYYPSLYRFAFSLTRHESDAADLTQQTFCVWASKGRQHLRDESKVKSWLFTTLYRDFLGRARKTSRFPSVDIETAEAELPEGAPFSFAAADGSALFGALSRVDPLFQAPVALFYLEDHSYPEIAAILGIPLGTVKSRISRGIAQLQELLAATAGSRKGAA